MRNNAAGLLCRLPRGADYLTVPTFANRRFSLAWRAGLPSSASNEPPPIDEGQSGLPLGHALADAPAPALVPAPVPVPVPGASMMLVLDALQSSSTLVRSAAQRWLIGTCVAPQVVMQPLLWLLISCDSTHRLHAYSLAKLRAALACMPAGTLPFLVKQPVPRDLVAACGTMLDEMRARAPSLLSHVRFTRFGPKHLLYTHILNATSEGTKSVPTKATEKAGSNVLVRHGPRRGNAEDRAQFKKDALTRRRSTDHCIGKHEQVSMVCVLAVSTLAAVLEPTVATSRILAAELLAAFIHTLPGTVGPSIALMSAEPSFLCLQNSVSNNACGTQRELLSLAYAALASSPTFPASDLVVQTIMLGISKPYVTQKTHLDMDATLRSVSSPDA